MPTWSNWSGSLQFTPSTIQKPKTEEALSELVIQAVRDGRRLRMVGAGHSSSPLVETHDMLISLENFQGLISHDASAGEAWLRTGMTVHDSGKALLDEGLAIHNTGDVDVQLLTGAIGTGTHGSGKTLQNLSSMLTGVRMVNAAGQIVEYRIENQPDFMRAAQVALGTLGIYTAIRIKVQPAFKLCRREWCTDVDSCMAHLPELMEQNRNFDFYWYPRSDEIKLRTMNLPGEGPDDIPYANCVEEKFGWGVEVLAKTRTLKFDEMEYALPLEAGPACFQEIRQRVKDKHRQSVAWRILYRIVAPDDAYISPASGRETVTISLHHNAGLPFEAYFNDIEPIFRAHGGRPHWGKKHNLTAVDLRPLYPMWDQFLQVRQQHDPNGVFLNAYLRELLGVQ